MNLDILLPTSLSEIPLVRYQKFIEMQEKSNDEELIANKMIQIFCGLELKEVLKIKLTDLNELILHFNNIFSNKPLLKRRFRIKDIEFGFIPNLENITFGEYVDLEKHLGNWKTYHKAMAVMYRPIKETFKDKYSIVDYEINEDMQDLMKYAPLDVAISSSLFFWSLGNELLNLTMTYLQQETKKLMTSQNSQKGINLQNNGAGIKASTNALKAMSLDLTKLQDYHLLNVSPISPLKSKKQKSKTENLNDK
jgi:hypothetical protein